MKNVLLLGHCGFDGPRIKSLLRNNLKVDVFDASSGEEASKFIRENEVHLVLVNRIFDATGESGIEWIGNEAKAGNGTKFMLISNFPEAQSEAVKKGALPGFGKNALTSRETLIRLQEGVGI